jgi:hypothetical protein
MNEPRKSDSPIVPMKAPNKAGQPAAEAVEGRGLAKGNPPQQNAPRTQCRPGASSALERVRQAVAQDGTYPCCAQSWRHHLRQEPDAVVPHVRIRGGGHGQPWSLLRPPASSQLLPASFGMTVSDISCTANVQTPGTGFPACRGQAFQPVAGVSTYLGGSGGDQLGRSGQNIEL